MKATNWISRHPVLGVLFTAVVSLILTAFGMLWLLKIPIESDMVAGSVALLVLIGVIISFSVKMDREDGDQKHLKLLKALAIIVALSFVQPAKAEGPPKQEAAWLIIGGTAVLIGGGVIAWRVGNKCSKIARARTNAWPEEFRAQGAAAPSEVGALFTWTEEGYCAEERLLPVSPTRFTICISVSEDTNVTTIVRAETRDDVAQTWVEFQEEMARHALDPTAEESFCIDGRPCEPQRVPISWDRETRTATLGHGALLLIERSSDLKEWTQVVRANITPGGLPWRIEDASSDQQFYRVSVR